MQQKSNQKKGSAASAIIAAICIVIYLAALVQAVVRAYISIEDRRVLAEQEFDILADRAASAGVLGFMNDQFIEAVNDTLEAGKTLEAVIITGPDNAYAFEREQDKWIHWVNNAPRFKDRPERLRQPLYRPLRIQGLRNVNIEAKASALDYALLSTILRETLLLVLAGLVISFFTLLIESLFGKSSEASQGRNRAEAPVYQAKTTVEGAGEKAASPLEPQPGEFTSEGAQETSLQDSSFNFSLPDLPPLGDIESDSGVKSEHDREIPKGLYSPHGNIGWEDYTTDRLESELHRCASFEQDLVLVGIEFQDQADDAFFNQFAEDAVHFFGPRDLIFEKGDRGIFVIYPNIDIDTAFVKCEEFHTRILGKYSNVFKSNTDLCMGLSSRSGRLIDAERLMLEAGEAVQRALADPVSHIVAFKSDPEKYRAFISKQRT
jgi:hypothetical protein